MEIYRGQVLAYDATNHKADVMLVGSMSGVVLGVPVAHHVGPEVMTADRACGVMFFGEGEPGVVVCTFEGTPPAWVTSALIKDGEVAIADLAFDPATQAELDAHEHLDLNKFGPTLDIDDLVMSWGDDFLGDSFHHQYALASAGAGSVVPTLQDGVHAGIARLTSGAVLNCYSALWLGDGVTNYDTLDADLGFVMIARMRFNVLTAGAFQEIMGTSNSARNRAIWVGINTVQVASNWMIYCRDAGLPSHSWTDTGVAFDTDWHIHAMEAKPSNGGRQVDYWLDGALLAEHTTNIDTIIRTPLIYSYSGGAVARNFDVDWLRLYPRGRSI